MSTALATEVLMPKLSDSMEEGTILTWLVDAGGAVEVGQPLLEVETDKANMTVAAEESGALEVLVGEGETVAVGTAIARLGGDAVGAVAGVGDAPESIAPPPAAPSAAPEPVPSNGASTRRSTPLARRIAADLGVEIDQVPSGSGVAGRIVRADVLAAAGVEPEPERRARPAPPVDAPSPAPSTAPVETAKGASRTVELSRLQAVIARRMAEAKATVPHFQVETEARMDAAIALRKELKEAAGEEPAPTFNDLIVKAAGLALRAHPKANGSYVGGAFELHDRVNVGIAVASDDALVVPTIFDADRRSLGEIGRDARRLASRVRAGETTPPELAGGTFTVSNLGMFGMTAIYPVINPPQAAILGVGKMRQILQLGSDAEIEDATYVTLTLSCDHRILYGAEAARFLATIRDLLETPLRLVL
jgi:pyruvate dehydrogenase E2 component (dihydrolipoamide acetyltransferase)